MTEEAPVKVSVIMMTYNHEKYIHKAIEGVLIQQTTFPVELIVANDHSADDTEKIVQDYRNKNAEIIKGYYNKRNLGPRYNFIKAFGQADGKYIAMCEGDDYWTDPFKLQKQVEFLEKNEEYVLAFHSISMVDENGNTADDQRQTHEKKRDYKINELLVAYLPTPTILFRKIFYKLPNTFKKVDNGDSLLQALLTRHGKSGYMCEILPAIVLVHSKSLWTPQTALQRWVSILKTRYLVFKTLDYPLRKQLYERYTDMFELASASANTQDTKKYWYKYNLRYLRFTILARHYGKTWLVGKRLIHKIFAA